MMNNNRNNNFVRYELTHIWVVFNRKRRYMIYSNKDEAYSYYFLNEKLCDAPEYRKVL